MTTKSVVTRGTVVIDIERCKGCDLCIDACRPGVLSMTVHELNSRGFRYPQLVDGVHRLPGVCQICPDYVFQVWKYDEPIVTEHEVED